MSYQILLKNLSIQGFHKVYPPQITRKQQRFISCYRYFINFGGNFFWTKFFLLRQLLQGLRRPQFQNLKWDRKAFLSEVHYSKLKLIRNLQQKVAVAGGPGVPHQIFFSSKKVFSPEIKETVL